GPYRRVVEVLNTTLATEGEPVYLVGYQSQDLGKPTEIEESTGGNAASGRQMAPAESMQMSHVRFGGIRQRDLQELDAGLQVRTECPQGTTCDGQVTKLSFGKLPEWTFLDF